MARRYRTRHHVFVPRWKLLAAAAVVVAALGAGGSLALRAEDGGMCNLVGCESGLFLDTTDLAYAPRSVRALRACVEAKCATVPRGRFVGYGGPQVDYGLRKAREVTVTAQLLDGEGRVLHRSERRLDLEAHYPNGKRCDGDGCVAGELRLDRDGDLHPRGPAPVTGFALLYRGHVLPSGSTISARHGAGIVVDAGAGAQYVSIVLRGKRHRAMRAGGPQRYIVGLPPRRVTARIVAHYPTRTQTATDRFRPRR